jgi:hypothetical protein
MKNDIETAKDHLLSYQRTLDDGLIGFRYSHEEAKMLVAYADQFIPKWISVEERLPEIKDHIDYECSDNVFVMCDDFIGVMALCMVDGFPVWCNCYGDINGDATHDDDYNVTHWQPLPSRLDEAAQNKTSKNI